MLGAKQALEIGLIDGIIQPSEVFELISGEKAIPVNPTTELNSTWKAIELLYGENSYKSIIKGDYTNGGMSEEHIAKLGKAMSFKAPIAMEFAEELIEAAKGPASELDKLVDIFTTKDALLGLTSIGKRVTYSGE